VTSVRNAKADKNSFMRFMGYTPRKYSWEPTLAPDKPNINQND
jgi:hypothetical protein